MNNHESVNDREHHFGDEAFPIINSLFNTREKAKVLLLLANPDMVGSIEFPVGFEQDFGYQTISSFIEDLEKELIDVNLYSDHEKYVISESDNAFGISVAYSLKLDSIWRLKDASTFGEKGLAFGIPATAVEAFPNHILADDQLPDTIKNHPYFGYLFFGFSPEHFQAEWDWFVAALDKAFQEHPDVARKLKLAV